MPTWAEAVKEYIDREGRRLAPSTVQTYQSTLEQTTKILKNKQVSKTTKEDIEDVLWGPDDSFLNRGLKANVINVRRGQICTFIRWCLAKRYLKDDITYRMGTLPAAPRVHRQMDAELMLDALDSAPNPRDRMLLALGTFTGSRISEIKDFELRHVDLERNMIEGVIRKTRKLYSAKMCPELRKEMDMWLAFYATNLGFLSVAALLAHAKKGNLEWYLVPRLTRPVLQGFRSVDTSQRRIIPTEQVANVYHMTRKLFARIGLEDSRGEGFHTLRRSVARQVYERACQFESSKDRAMRMTQLYLNHSSMAVTEKYVGVTVEQAALNEFLETTSLLGDVYEARYGTPTEDNVVQLRARDA